MKVVPVRFTEHVPEMRRFFEVLGLTTTLTSHDGGWASLEARGAGNAPGGGGMGVHAASTATPPRRPGTTELAFATAEPLEVVAGRLTEAGYEALVQDEAFGRILRTVDPDGVEVWVNEDMTDLYGYVQID